MEFGLVAIWLAVFLALLYAGGTLANVVFPRFADRGLGVALPLALLVLWTVAYLVGHVSLTAGVWLGVLAVVGLAALATRHGASVDRSRYLETAAVFTVAFLFLVAIRAVDPAIQPLGGEKFLDFGLLKSLVRADRLPPEDMWFAGEPIPYYYGGHLLAALLTRITGTAGRYAYNLALAGYYGILVTAVYGLAGSVAADRGVSRRVAGATGAFLVGVASNLATPGKLLLWLLPDGLATPLAGAFGIPMEGVPVEGPGAFSYWSASRVITDDPADFVLFDPATAYVIDEFPLFAWLNGDMHAHMMSTPFLLLGAAILFSYYRTPATSTRRRRALLLGCLPLVAGMVAVVNTWSFPTVGGLAFLTVAMAPADPRGLVPGLDPTRSTGGPWRREGTRLGIALGVAGAVLAVGLVLSLPFWLTAASGRQVAFLPDRSSLGELLVVHGPFLFAFASYLYLRVADVVDREAAAIGGLLSLAVVAAAAAADLAALGLFVPLVGGAWFLRRGPSLTERLPGAVASDGGRDAGVVGFEGVLIVAGTGLVTLVEFVFVAENVGRMNTVFKTYMQVWVLWAPAAGVALAYVADYWPRRRAVAWKGALARSFVALLLLSTAVYAGLALAEHTREPAWTTGGEGPTLNGTAWIAEAHPDEAAAISWLRDEVEGRPNIVTAAPGGYRWQPSNGQGASAPASLTGIPTVAGWYHEAQYRNESIYEHRVADVETIYEGTPAAQTALLAEYDVRYVYVGPAERARYGTITVDELSAVTPVREFGDVTIYRVDRDELGE